MGHLNQERKNLKSTKKEPIWESIEEEEAFHFPTTQKDNCKMVFSVIHPYSPKTTAYSDLTGQFPYKLSNGNWYIYVLYDYDSNTILIQAIPNGQAQTIAKAWKTITDRLTKTATSFSIMKYLRI